MLQSKSLTQLRGIAQSYDVPNLFSLDKNHLIQAIELKQTSIAPRQVIDIPKPEYDARLMTKSPSRKSSEEEINELLAPYVALGLRISYDPERWYMAIGKKTDEGTLRMPLRIVLKCAEAMMK